MNIRSSITGIFLLLLLFSGQAVKATDLESFQNASRFFSKTTIDDPTIPSHPIQSPKLARGVLLIAGQYLNDPNFGRSVVLITEFNPVGTTGLVINRRTTVPTNELFPKLAELDITSQLYIGGPVAPSSIRLLVQTSQAPEEAKQILDDVYIIDTSSVLDNLLNNLLVNTNVKIFAGYAGWAPGQLESELLRGDWYIWHATSNIVFERDPATLWDELIEVVRAKWVLNDYLPL